MDGQNVASRWPLAEREGELEAFKQAWGERHCQSVMVCGTAGVGKSRLADECLSRAVRGGWKAGRATVTPASASVPLSAVAHLIPAEVDLSDPVKGFAAVARLLAGPRGDRRWVVLVDDLHLLDSASAVLLRQLLDARVVRLIATVRTGEPISEAVDALTGGDSVHRIDLAAFDEQQLDAVLRVALRGPVGRHTLRRLFTVSGGNVLYLRELVLGALHGKTLVSDGEIWELKDGALLTTPKLTELIGARLAATAPAARPILELLALAEPLPLSDLQTVSSRQVLNDLDAAGLLHVLTDRRRTTVALAHPLYGELLRAKLPVLRGRQLLLEQIARIQSHGARRRQDALHLVTWHLAATGTADPSMLVQGAVLASHVHDYRQADALLQALPEAGRTYTSCLLHGDVLLKLGLSPRADTLLAEAEIRGPGESERVTATSIRTWILFFFSARTDEALEVNEAALRQVADAEARHMLTLNKASMCILSGQPARGLALLEDLEAVSRQASEVGHWAFAALCKTFGLACTGRTGEAIAWGEHAYASHLQIKEQEIGPPPVAQVYILATALADAGQLASARKAAERALADPTLTESPLAEVWAALFRGRVEWLSGNPAAARRWYADAAAKARTHRYCGLLFHASAGLTAAASVLADPEAAEAALAEMRAQPPMGFYAGEEVLGEAWYYAARGDLARSRMVLTRAAKRARESGHVTSEALLLTDVARLGGAKEVVDRLAELTQLCDGAFAATRAHLAAALATDDPDQLLCAAAELEAVGAYLLAAEAANAAATAWQRTGQTRLATGATNQAQASAAYCPGARTPLLTAATTTTASLTQREHEVALLAAAGTASKDIATALHLSVRTVDNHLQRVYTKLGVTTRRELAGVIRREIGGQGAAKH
ncbi:LuxR C-terminal-related transcriptional regulator [Streptomyces sp. 1222.5]|uniref:helix-turn-helix transcriptional regulator n=1 Tax=Streptomyces sp. 1222.5 TaxID=1881026 RepID=UPI003EBC2AEC